MDLKGDDYCFNSTTSGPFSKNVVKDISLKNTIATTSQGGGSGGREPTFKSASYTGAHKVTNSVILSQVDLPISGGKQDMQFKYIEAFLVSDKKRYSEGMEDYIQRKA